MEQTMWAWRMETPGEPLILRELPLPEPKSGEVLLEVLACGLCHTDVSFLYGGVRTNVDPPLTLGHEILGRVQSVGPGAVLQAGQVCAVPAVLPCGDCEMCNAGRGRVCRNQKMPGNDFDGGFASHFLTPERFLCPVPDALADQKDLAVVADAVSTAFQAVEEARVEEGDLCAIVGVGGVGTFVAQIADARGAKVVALDIDSDRLESIAGCSERTIDLTTCEVKDVRKMLRSLEKELGVTPLHRKIFECSGTAAGQELAWTLLGHNAVLMVVGFTLDTVPVRLSNLMAFDARAIGNWGCEPAHYPTIMKLIQEGELELAPFVEHIPMSRVNDLLREHRHARRPVLIPDFEGS